MSQYKKWFTAAIVMAMLICAPAAMAKKERRESERERKEWMGDIRELKHTFFKKELGLTRDQETAFFRLYDQMDDELFKVADETRALERKISNKANATDTELETAARAQFEQRKKEAEIELRYFEEFKNVLTKRQLLKIKDVERRFNRALLNRTIKKDSK